MMKLSCLTVGFCFLNSNAILCIFLKSVTNLCQTMAPLVSPSSTSSKLDSINAVNRGVNKPSDIVPDEFSSDP